MPRLPKTVLIDHKRNEYELIEPGSPVIENEKLQLSKEPGSPVIENEKLQLSKRESEVLHLLAEGLTTKEIAQNLGITFHTAATYRKRLREKTKVKNTTELVNYALVQALL